jgi:hypothetical protein
MTSNTTPAPYITSTNLGGDAYRAFQHNTTSGLAINAGEWLKVDMNVGKTINHYGINSFKPSAHPSWLWNTPKSWTLQASNDDSAWTTIHTVTGNPEDEGLYCFKYIGNTTSYRYYRLVLTGTYDPFFNLASFNQILLAVNIGS